MKFLLMECLFPMLGSIPNLIRSMEVSMSKFGWFLGGAVAGGILTRAAQLAHRWHHPRKENNMTIPPVAPGFPKFPNTSRQEDACPFGSMEGQAVPSLKSVAVSGEVHGLLFKSTIRQEYRNETKDTLEVIYTFPMAWGTVLLGMAAEMGGKKLTGVVIKKDKAEEQYEKAIQDGDSAILLQESARGLYTANLGNIKPGESVAVEIRSAQLLRFEQDRVRLCIPTVIGERYGESHGPGKLAAHESAGVDGSAQYTFALRIMLTGDMAKSVISSPTHGISCENTENGLLMTLNDGASLDRDFVLLMEQIPQSSLVLDAPGEEGHMLLASFVPHLPPQKTAPLAVKVLVDCSGSMSGERIEQARKGLRQVVALLNPDDHMSYSRFGSEVAHMTKTMLPCSEKSIEHLASLVKETDADMGGTEMESALASTFADIDLPRGCEAQPALLIITDGDVWEVEDIIQAAQKSGHRIFAIGVGSAPAESLLREMAERTGGACEFVTPGENMAEAVLRMFHRIRGVIARDIRIDWGGEPVWQSALPQYLYDGETVHCFALMKSAPEVCPTLNWSVRGDSGSAQAASLEIVNDEDMLRMGKMRQMKEAKNPRERLDIALKYQLVSDQTSFILTCIRDDGDKVEGLPRVQHVKQMPAHGHGCFAGVDCLISPYLSFADKDSSIPTYLPIKKKVSTGELLRRQIDKIVSCWNMKKYTSASVMECLADIIQERDMGVWRHLVSKLQCTNCLSKERIWAIIVRHLLEESNAGQSIDRHSLRLLNAALNSVSKADIDFVRARLGQVW